MWMCGLQGGMKWKYWMPDIWLSEGLREFSFFSFLCIGRINKQWHAGVVTVFVFGTEVITWSTVLTFKCLIAKLVGQTWFPLCESVCDVWYVWFFFSFLFFLLLLAVDFGDTASLHISFSNKPSFIICVLGYTAHTHRCRNVYQCFMLRLRARSWGNVMVCLR